MCGDGIKQTVSEDGYNEICDGYDGCSAGYICNSSCGACMPEPVAGSCGPAALTTIQDNYNISKQFLSKMHNAWDTDLCSGGVVDNFVWDPINLTWSWNCL